MLLYAFCLPFVPRGMRNSLRHRLLYIGYNVKEFVCSMGINFCFGRGMDSLSKSKRGQGPSS